jgi:nicotinate-nucleotide pyrophosphorylase (carboxylating)
LLDVPIACCKRLEGQWQEKPAKEKGMDDWSEVETIACRRLVDLALAEDLDQTGDRTSRLLPAELKGQAALVARRVGVIAGLPAVRMVYEALGPCVEVEFLQPDGSRVQAGTVLAMVRGSMRTMLTGERTALNFVQHLSGVATMTWRYVQALAGLPCRIMDTRKTLPGWRRLEKYAVRCGGGVNHRLGLFDGILIKDNHLAALREMPDPFQYLLTQARSTDRQVPIEVEVDTLEQLDRALAARPDIVLLDNMDLATLREAVRRRNQHAPAVKLEASGGVTLDTVRGIAETGVDRISVGALTHSAPSLDVALDYQ